MRISTFCTFIFCLNVFVLFNTIHVQGNPYLYSSKVYYVKKPPIAKECVTPNKEIAKCVPINKCESFLNIHIQNFTPKIKEFTKKSFCGSSYFGAKRIPYICCGSVFDYEIISETIPDLEPEISVDIETSSISSTFEINNVPPTRIPSIFSDDVVSPSIPPTSSADSVPPTRVPSTFSVDNFPPPGVPSVSSVKNIPPPRPPSSSTDSKPPPNIPSSTSVDNVPPPNIPATSSVNNVPPSDIPATSSVNNIPPSQMKCLTPNNEKAQCIPLNECKLLSKPSTKTINTLIFKFIRQSIATCESYSKSNKHTELYVCCGTILGYQKPKVDKKPSVMPCRTPNNEMAQCIPRNQCEIIDKFPKENMTEDTALFINESMCMYKSDFSDMPYVCCGSVVGYEFLSNIPTKPTTTTEMPLPPVMDDCMMGDEPMPRIAINKINYTKHPNYKLLPPRGICGRQVDQNKIIGGVITNIDEFPWLALLVYKNIDDFEFGCGGSLINERYVLTAAHCLRRNLVSVRLGEYNVETDPDVVHTFEGEDMALPHQQIDIEDAISYKGYKHSTKYNDIGLIRLKRNVMYHDFVKPICLPILHERSAPGEQLVVAGWGIQENHKPATIKMKVNVPVWSDRSCVELYNLVYKNNLRENQMCAGGEEGKDSCKGDSGGPLMRTFPGKIEYYVEGIVSFGPTKCGTLGVPSVYIRVSGYIDWILDNMKHF